MATFPEGPGVSEHPENYLTMPMVITLGEAVQVFLQRAGLDAGRVATELGLDAATVQKLIADDYDGVTVSDCTAIFSYLGVYPHMRATLEPLEMLMPDLGEEDG